jgi:hypothetical protein
MSQNLAEPVHVRALHDRHDSCRYKHCYASMLRVGHCFQNMGCVGDKCDCMG